MAGCDKRNCLAVPTRARACSGAAGLLIAACACCQVADVPKVWNAKMKEYLGVEPKDDAQGCLQVRVCCPPAAGRRFNAHYTACDSCRKRLRTRRGRNVT